MRANAMLYERLVERYVGLEGWPTSRKTVLLAAFVLPFQLLAGVTLLWGARRVPGLLNDAILDRYLAIWFATTVLFFVAALLAARRSSDGRWTVYALILVHGSLLAGLVNLFGVLSTPFLLFYAASPYMVLLFFDLYAGAVAVLFATTLLLASAVLAVTGWVPYAPVLVARSLDAQLHPAWIAVMTVTIFLAFAANLAPVLLAVSARRRQEARLSAAHDELQSTQRMLECGNRLICRYVPRQVAEKILSGDHEEHTRPERRRLTLFFSDVVGFTATADQMEPEDFAALLNEYLSEMLAIAERHKATVNQLVGDGIMAFFGAPEFTSDRDHALRCVNMALSMQERLEELGRKWRAQGVANPFEVRIGINTGVASVGDFGSAGRMTYSAIGNQTNLAARIQAVCDPGKVLVSHSTWSLVNDAVAWKAKGEITLKGFRNPVRIYEVGYVVSREARAS